MDPKQLKKIWLEMLNLPEARAQLSKNIPLVKRLEAEKALTGLRMTGSNWTGDVQLLLAYEAIASEDIYPGVTHKLIARNTIVPAEHRFSIPAETGSSSAYELLKLGIPKGPIVINLRVYNPEYKFGR